MLAEAVPALARAARQERERSGAMAALEALGTVLRSCQQEALQDPGRLADICLLIRHVLERKVPWVWGGGPSGGIARRKFAVSRWWGYC